MNKRNQKKHILFYIGSLAGGGAERVLINILQHLDRNKFECFLLVHKLKGEYTSSIPEDVKIFERSGIDGIRNIFSNISTLNDIVDKEEIDLVLSFMDNTNRALMRASIFGKSTFKTILSVHNNPTKKVFKEHHFIYNLLRFTEINLLYRLADKVVSVSEGIRKEFQRTWHLGTNNFTVIYNPIDIKKVQAKAMEAARLPWNEPINFKLICSIGRFVPQKGYSDLIDVFNEVRKKIPAKLLILGQGNLKNEIKSKISALNLNDHVYLPGFVENPWAYLKTSDLYLSTSYWEGHPLSIVEAMACSLPVVATDCNYGPSEIIMNGSGALAPVGDVKQITNEVLRLLKLDEEGRIKLSKKVQKRANDFDVSIIVKKYEKMFDEVLSS
jgi:glycosyltransferase involved in cell wall biosynthesis